MKRAVRSVILIIAAAFVVFGVLEIGMELIHYVGQVHHHIKPIKTNIWHYLIGAVLLVIGVVLFLGSESLAEQLTDDIED